MARSLRASVDVTRLSRIALHNLEREGEEGNDYAGGAAAGAAGDIAISNADAELDFEEARDEGGCLWLGAELGEHARHATASGPSVWALTAMCTVLETDELYQTV